MIRVLHKLSQYIGYNVFGSKSPKGKLFLDPPKLKIMKVL